VKNAFQELMEEQMKQYNIREKVDTLYEKCIEEVKEFNRISKESEKEMDNLNDRVTRAKNYADKRCQKLRTGKIPYSKTIQEAMGSCIVLKIIQKRWLLRGKRRRPKTRELKRAMKKFNFRGKYYFETKDEIDEALKIATKKYHKLRPKASEQRETFLGNLAAEMEEDDGIKAASHFKTLQHCEETRSKFQRIKCAEQKTHGGGVSVVEKEVNGVREKYEQKKELKKEIIRANKEKVLQANNTP
jgi:hypothetical protein